MTPTAKMSDAHEGPLLPSLLLETEGHWRCQPMLCWNSSVGTPVPWFPQYGSTVGTSVKMGRISSHPSITLPHLLYFSNDSETVAQICSSVRLCQLWTDVLAIYFYKYPVISAEAPGLQHPLEGVQGEDQEMRHSVLGKNWQSRSLDS